MDDVRQKLFEQAVKIRQHKYGLPPNVLAISRDEFAHLVETWDLHIDGPLENITKPVFGTYNWRGTKFIVMGEQDDRA